MAGIMLERYATMPNAAPRICSHCRKLVYDGRCSCRPAWQGSHSPPSTRRWRNLRATKLGVHPRCQWSAGCDRPATEVDKIIPYAEAPWLRYDWDNLQSLCHDHHEEKTLEDARRGKQRLR
jgi:5-methylcytosine-specific restriction protein A